MKTAFVIFREGLDDGDEVYVAESQTGRSTIVEITDALSDALQFATAREAYEWARMRKLDWWKVGAR
jgi:hypothetical protein